MDTNVALIMGRVLWKLAGYGSGATALGVVDVIGSASRTFFGIGAGLRATFVFVDELYVGVFIDRDLEVGDGRLLLGNVFAARNGGAAALGNLSVQAITLSNY